MTTSIAIRCARCGGMLGGTMFGEDGQPYHFGCRPSQQTWVGDLARIADLEADNRILTAELRSYFQQYGWESTERILKHHGAERSTP